MISSIVGFSRYFDEIYMLGDLYWFQDVYCSVPLWFMSMLMAKLTTKVQMKLKDPGHKEDNYNV